MSDMNGNPHYDIANGAIYSPCTSESEATPALAFEQRTANIFAYWNVMTAGVDLWEDTPQQHEWDAMQRDIKTRLGINEGATK